MEHLAYCDTKANELAKLLNGSKTAIIRGAAGRKLPHGRVEAGETIYLIENNGDGLIKAKGIVEKVFHSDKLNAEESSQLINTYSDKLQLTPAQLKRWSSKRYLCIVEINNIEKIEPFSYERAGNMDDWITVEDINSIRK